MYRKQLKLAVFILVLLVATLACNTVTEGMDQPAPILRVVDTPTCHPRRTCTDDNQVELAAFPYSVQLAYRLDRLHTLANGIPDQSHPA